eukprot:2022092-Alexandrium_andersonii.AAC.1
MHHPEPEATGTHCTGTYVKQNSLSCAPGGAPPEHPLTTVGTGASPNPFHWHLGRTEGTTCASSERCCAIHMISKGIGVAASPTGGCNMGCEHRRPHHDPN